MASRVTSKYSRQQYDGRKTTARRLIGPFSTTPLRPLQLLSFLVDISRVEPCVQNSIKNPVTFRKRRDEKKKDVRGQKWHETPGSSAKQTNQRKLKTMKDTVPLLSCSLVLPLTWPLECSRWGWAVEGGCWNKPRQISCLLPSIRRKRLIHSCILSLFLCFACLKIIRLCFLLKGFP